MRKLIGVICLHVRFITILGSPSSGSGESVHVYKQFSRYLHCWNKWFVHNSLWFFSFFKSKTLYFYILSIKYIIELLGWCDFMKQFPSFRTVKIILFVDVVSLLLKKLLCSIWMGIMKSILNLVCVLFHAFIIHQNKMLKTFNSF